MDILSQSFQNVSKRRKAKRFEPGCCVWAQLRVKITTVLVKIALCTDIRFSFLNHETDNGEIVKVHVKGPLHCKRVGGSEIGCIND